MASSIFSPMMNQTRTWVKRKISLTRKSVKIKLMKKRRIMMSNTKEMLISQWEVPKKLTWTMKIRICAKSWQTRYKHLLLIRLEVWTKHMMRLRKIKMIELRSTKYLIQEHLLFCINSSKTQRLNIFTDASVPVKKPMSTKQQVDAKIFQPSKCYKKENPT